MVSDAFQSDTLTDAFKAILGQPQAVELLRCTVAKERLAPGYLFVGSEGIGRRLTAQAFASLILTQWAKTPHPSSLAGTTQRVHQGNHPDLLWVAPTYPHQGQLITAAEAEALGVKRRTPPQIRLEQVRDIARFLSRPPLESHRSVIVVEDADTMAEAAANGLLKTLEEPGRATLILIATSVDSLLPTIVSRCQRIPFYRLSTEVMATVLMKGGYDEILNHPELLDLAQGSPGVAIAHWQQLDAIPPELLETVTQRPKSLRHALELAKQIDHDLSNEAQLWLLEYLQHSYWRQYRQHSLLQSLEQARRFLLSYAQPRLVWEVTLLNLI
jgi:DNA polymerase-3 subunit delta'